LILEHARPSDVSVQGRKTVTRLELALLVALVLILLSAFRRVILYEQAYGFTTARLFAQAYMVVVSLALIALGLDVVRGGVTVAFGRRVAEIALGVFTLLVFWNYEGWIVNRNIDRAGQTGKFDLAYARRLSSDAIPTLISRRHDLGPAEAANVEAAIRCAPGKGNPRWFEWNRSADAQLRALQSAHPGTCPVGESLYWIRQND
jgi:hypothetical protein